jgi:hypothetical protein
LPPAAPLGGIVPRIPAVSAENRLEAEVRAANAARLSHRRFRVEEGNFTSSALEACQVHRNRLDNASDAGATPSTV